MREDEAVLRARLALTLLLVLTVVAAACGDDTGGDGPIPSSSVTLSAEMASVDLYAGAPQHVEVGIFGTQGDQGVRLVTFGTIDVGFTYLGDGSAAPEPGPTATASYIPAFGTADTGAAPTLSTPADARGVYGAEVTFDRAGVWQATIEAAIEGAGAQRLTAAFEVATDPAYPAPGDRAPRSRNLTATSPGVPITAVDSAAVNGELPDPELHDWTVARAIAEHRPILLIVATPAFCQSRFCGPETDAVASLADRFGDRAVFIHIEVWKEYPTVMNQGAADWIFRDGDATEPWTFLIGANGRVVDRWMPLFDVDQVAAALQQLPPTVP
jgi:hypothetical protein